MAHTLDLVQLLGQGPTLKADHDPTDVMSSDPSTILGNGIGSLSGILLQLPQVAIGAIATVLTGVVGAGLTALQAWVGTIATVGGIVASIIGTAGSLLDLSNWFGGLESMLGFPDFGSGSFDPVAAVLNFATTLLNPLGIFANLTGGFLSLLQLPGFDASKVISGQFPVSMITGLEDLLAIPGALITNVVNFIYNGWNSLSPDTTGANPEALHGIFAGIQSGLKGLTTTVTTAWNAITGLGASIAQVLGGLGSLPQYLDPSAFVSTALTIGSGLATTAVGALAGIIGSLDNFWLALTGQASRIDSGTTSTGTSTQLSHLADTVASLGAQVQQISAGQNGSTNSGMSGGDNFERVSITDLGSLWVQTYSVGSMGVLATPNGHDASWIDNGGSSCDCKAIRAAAAPDALTETDYQSITFTIGSVIAEYPFFTPYATHSAYGRVNSVTVSGHAAGTIYVRAYVDSDNIKLYYANGGAESQLGSTVANPGLSPGVTYTLQCGTQGGINVYRILRNQQVMLTFTDSGSLTQWGANFRSWGWGEGAGGYGSGQLTPSSITGVTIADNFPATVQGVGLNIFRASATTVTINAGAPIAGSVWDTFDTVSADCGFSGGVLTINTPGFWTFNLSVQGSALPGSSRWMPCIYMNGNVRAQGIEYFTPGASHTNDTWSFYCPAGTTIQPGWSASTAAMFAAGDAGGVGTYFTAMLGGRAA